LRSLLFTGSSTVSEEFQQRISGPLEILLEHPVSGVLEDDELRIRRHQLDLLPNTSPLAFSPPTDKTGIVSLV
jgi:hypothetical protein